MKTISGNLVSVKAISLSKAAKYISHFASFENNGVSDVVCIYLNHASEAFNSLVQLNKDLKRPQSSHKKHLKKSISEKKIDAILRNDEMLIYDDEERKTRSSDEKQDELLEDKRVGEIKEGYGSVRISGIEGMGASKKDRKNKIHNKECVEPEDNISSELRKEGKNGGNVEVGDMVNRSVDQRKNNKKKNVNNQERLKMEDNVDGESKLKVNSVEPTGKKRKRSKA